MTNLKITLVVMSVAVGVILATIFSPGASATTTASAIPSKVQSASCCGNYAVVKEPNCIICHLLRDTDRSSTNEPPELNATQLSSVIEPNCLVCHLIRDF